MALFLTRISFLFFIVTASQAQSIDNGGFEKGLWNWTRTDKPGVQANVQTIIERSHGTGNSLQVSISGSGRDSLVRIATGNIPLDTGRIYMLRFWAIAKDRAANVDARIGTPAVYRQCHFEVYDSDGPWHMYQYLFKPRGKEGAVTLLFGSPSTFWIDDVELLDDRDTLLDLKTQFMWQSAHLGYGWISGDDDVSVPLPDGRNAWILNDSFIGMLNDQSNVLKDVKMITNLIVLEEHKPQATLTSVFGGTIAEPKALFPPTAYTLYWISDAMVAGGKLQVLLQEWNWAYKFTNRAFVATLSLPALKVESMIKTAYNGSDIPGAMLQEKDYTYIYTAQRVDTLNRYTRIARIPGGLIDPKATWQFLAEDRTWTADTARAARMIAGTEIASVVKLGDSNYVFSGVPNLKSELAVRFAKTPIGPWTAPVTVYHVPEESGILPYLGHIHKGTKKDGVYTLSVSLFPHKGGWFQQLSDRGCYLPQYVRVDLEKLSPYTRKVPTRITKAPARTRARGAAAHKQSGAFSLTGRRIPVKEGREIRSGILRSE